ncbi:DUF4405 domain-containing protein [Actibacterium ureilyticum]|uniref:DUF4405 domain-containing protein n=1 Tax=Actibacterium ureilyticum TaxID=1590614 RepID=UPI000BAAF5E9|nr:DUF4405 domain-containing protein [Actibacterium ureilyticum]
MTLRSWATPLTVGAFLIMSVTGSLMFFHLNSGLNKTVHEWAGWAMVIGVGAHLVLNWRAFTTYFKRPLAKAVMGLGVVVLAASFVPTGSGAGDSPVRAAMGALGRADVASVVALTDRDLQAALDALQSAGIPATGQDTIASLSDGDRAREGQILNILFAE